MSRFDDQYAHATSKIRQWLSSEDVVEIMLNPNGKIWVDWLGKGMVSEDVQLSPDEGETLIHLVANYAKTTVTYDNPIVSAELPDGSRFEGLVPPVVKAPVFSIRRHTSKVFSLQEYVEQEILIEPWNLPDDGAPEEDTVERVPRTWKEALEYAVGDRKNILVVGSTSSGKTTFSNSILREIAKRTPTHRVITIEDTPELKVDVPNTVSLRTSDTVSATRLLKSCMRLRPDRIIVGEVRDKAALDLLKAWNTGHPGGLSTVHANSSRAGLTRLEQLCLEADIKPEASRPLIAEAVDLVLFISKISRAPGRRFRSLISVESELDGGEYVIRPVIPPPSGWSVNQGGFYLPVSKSNESRRKPCAATS